MLKRTLRSLVPLTKLNIHPSYQVLSVYSRPNIKWCTSIKPNKIHLRINNQLLNAKKLQDLLFLYGKIRDSMNLINCSVLLKQLFGFQKGSNPTPVAETYYNEIVNQIISKIEKENSQDPRLISTLYFQMNQLPYNNQFKKRCEFLLEQKGMEVYKDMNSQEISSFLHTLAKNSRKSYFQTILPHIVSNINNYSLRTLLTILYDSSILDLKIPQLGKIVQEMIIEGKEGLKISSLDYSFIFFYCGKNPDIMNDPRLFSKLESIAKFQVMSTNGIALSNIFHSLTFYDKPMVSKEFYNIFESRILHILPEISNQALSLILRGYSAFKFGSERFYQKIMEEACRRVNQLDSEDLSTILYHLKSVKGISTTMLGAFTQRLVKTNCADVSPKQFEHIFYAYYNLEKDGSLVPDKALLDVFNRYVISNINKFALKELGALAIMSSMLNKESQKAMFEEVLARVTDPDNFEFTTLDLRSLGGIAYFVIYDFPDRSTREFDIRIIDTAISLVEKSFDKEENQKAHNYGKLLVGLTQQGGLDQTYLAKRKYLFELVESWLIKHYERTNSLPENFILESVLMSFITSFYIILGKPSNKVKNILKEALSSQNLTSFKPNNLTFLHEKTDLVDKVFENEKSRQGQFMSL